MYKYAQIQAKRRKDAQNTCKCGQILANTRRYVQIRANTSRYTHICAKTRKYMKTHPNTHRYTQISCDERSARASAASSAHEAKRRKDTANSHEQLQGAPFSSVRRHVPASLIIITRFPFTYQTGFERGSKKSSFLASIFASILGSILGLVLDQKSHIFSIIFKYEFQASIFMQTC